MTVITRLPFLHSRRQETIVGLGSRQISQAVGFEPDLPDPGRVDAEWSFLADGVPCAVWGRYPFPHFSAFGPADVLAKVFGAEHVRAE